MIKKNIIIVVFTIIIVSLGFYIWPILNTKLISLENNISVLDIKLDQKQNEIKEAEQKPNIQNTYAPVLLMKQNKELNEIDVFKIIKQNADDSLVKVNNITYKNKEDSENIGSISNYFELEIIGDKQNIKEFVINIGKEKRFFIENFDIKIKEGENNSELIVKGKY